MNTKLTTVTFISFILGIVLGIFFPAFTDSFAVVGTIYINLIKMLIVPLLFLSITNIFIKHHFSTNVTFSVLLLFVPMFVVSFLLNFIFIDTIKPGLDFEIPTVEVWEIDLMPLNLTDNLLNVITTDNIFSAVAHNQLLPVIIFSLAFGCALQQLNLDILDSILIELNQVFNKLLSWVMYLMPLGVFSLIGATTASVGTELILSSFIYILMAWLGSILVITCVMILPVWFICRISPLQQIKKLGKLWIMAMSTCSSVATLPETIKTCTQEFHISIGTVAIAIPLGCTINKCGEAISSSLLALFTAQICHQPISHSMFFTMLFLSFIFNLNTPGVPGGGLIFGATYLNLLGLPNIFMGVYVGIYRLLDTIFTTVNVTGDIAAACIIDKFLNNNVDYDLA